MYPKPTIFSHQRPGSESHRVGRRDQIARMLINKFRQKFNVDFDSDNRLDAKIVDTVNSAVKSDEPLGEKQLVLLSRKLNQVVEDVELLTANLTSWKGGLLGLKRF